MERVSATNTTVRPATKSPSLLGGALIIAGTAVGAGMFSLPIAFAGMWFNWSLLVLAVTWFFMFHSGLMILEANLNYPVGSSFDTMVKDALGKGWNIVNGLSLAFVLYILDYAYISGGGSIIKQTIFASTGAEVSQKLAGFGFAFFTALVIWFSTRAVDRVTTILLGGMILTFFFSSHSLLDSLDTTLLFNSSGPETGYLPFIFVALPYCLTSFGFHGNVPSLMKYYGKQPDKIVRCLRYGTLLALTIYTLWLICAFGNLSRLDFKPIIADGGNVAVLVAALSNATDSALLPKLLNAFANLAVTSSFLGVSLGLFDFVADKFKFNDSPMGRFKTALVTFVPPTFGALIHPDGFLYAIGFAGLGATVWGAIVPAMMVRACRKRFGSEMYRVWGGNALVYGVILFGVLYGSCHVLAMLHWLPVYR
jgi:tryptophan-specific transport protein